MYLISHQRLLAVFVVIGLISGATAQVRTIDPKQSRVTVHVFKSGLFSAFGHNHEIAAPVSGTIDESRNTVELMVSAAGLKVLDPDRPEKETAEVQRTMAGPEVLDVQSFPTIHFRSDSVRQSGPDRFNVHGELTLHGQTKPATIEATRTGDGHYRASTTLKQTDFGIKPVVAAGGTVKVKNEVKLDFTIVTPAVQTSGLVARGR